jgi:hypothetical protein
MTDLTFYNDRYPGFDNSFAPQEIFQQTNYVPAPRQRPVYYPLAASSPSTLKDFSPTTTSSKIEIKSPTTNLPTQLLQPKNK